MKAKYLFNLVLFCVIHFPGQSQTKSRFTPFSEGQAFTAIAVDKLNKKIWAGTNGQGIFNLKIKDSLATNLSLFTPGISLNSDPYSFVVKDIAIDTNGRVYFAHEGTSSTITNGGVYQINSVGNAVDFNHERNAKGFGAYIKRGGLPGSRISSIEVDVNNRVWVSNKHQLLTVSTTSIVTPGAIGYRDAGNLLFQSYGGWYTNEGILNAQPSELPYPANTRLTAANITANQETRSMRAISSDEFSIWFGCAGYRPANAPTSYIPARVLVYNLKGNFIADYSLEEMHFKFGIVNGILTNNENGVWVTKSFGAEFSVKVGPEWSNTNDAGLDFSKIIPTGTIFNDNAIWKDDFDRVFMGTTKGLIVYDGEGDPKNQNSYKIYTKEAIVGFSEGNELNIIDPSMLSNNITGGGNDVDSITQWIATDNGVMKAVLPTDKGMQVYHVVNHSKYGVDTKNTEENIKAFAKIKNRLNEVDFLLEDSRIPGVSADSSASTVFRLYTPNAGVYYEDQKFAKKRYRWFVGPGPLAKAEFDQNYKDRYGFFELKSLESYEEIPKSLDDLTYVDFIYHHPLYIDKKDFVTSKKYSKEDFTIVEQDTEANQTVIFKNSLRITVPPILMVHGVWTSIDSFKKMEDYFKDKGYDKLMLSRVWRTDAKAQENKSFKSDAHFIPNSIDKLKNAALVNNFSVGKVNVIGHSRGGLYTRAYIEGIEEGYDHEKRKDINSLITLNTPHFGSQGGNFALDKRKISSLIYPENSWYLSPKDYFLQLIPEDLIKDLTVGDIASIVAPEEEPEPGSGPNGAYNLIVEKDNFSGIDPNNHDHFIEKINSNSNRSKMKNVPFHVVSSDYNLCRDNPKKCSDFLDSFFKKPGSKDVIEAITEDGGFFGKIRTLAKSQAIGILKSLIVSGAIKSLDEFNEKLLNDKNDFIVPLSSMNANLVNTSFNTHFIGITHSTFPTVEGITEDSRVAKKLDELLVGNVYDQTNNGKFTQRGIPNPEKLTYDIFSNLPRPSPNIVLARNINKERFSKKVSRSQKSSELTSKIIINRNPEVFDNLVEGDTLNFKVYSENVDKIILVYEGESKDDFVSSVAILNPAFEVNVKYVLPEDLHFSGESKITAYGFIEGETGFASNYVTFNLKTPSDALLQSIRFDTEYPTVLNQDNFSFDLLGMYSDGLERKITNKEEIIYKIEDTTVISRFANKGFKAESKGVSVLQASINDLESSILVTVEENPSLFQTILTSFYGQLNEDNLSVDISWTTLQEYKNDTFVLEASYSNADNFIELSSQPGNGTSKVAASFSFQDASVGDNDTIFYRLKMIDTDGVESYSTTIEILKKKDVVLSNDDFDFVDDSFLLYPNPVKTEKLSININANFSDEEAQIELYSLHGKKLLVQPLSIVNGENAINLKIPNQLSEGVYLVRLTTKSYIKTIRLVIER